MLDKAIQMASKAHEGQVQLNGEPYILHPLRVMASVATIQEKTVAVLHDVVEDTNITIEDIAEQFSPEITKAVYLLTKKYEVPYEEYIAGIKANKLARTVKLADLQDNMNITRLPFLGEKELVRLQKYQSAYIELSL